MSAMGGHHESQPRVFPQMVPAEEGLDKSMAGLFSGVDAAVTWLIMGEIIRGEALALT